MLEKHVATYYKGNGNAREVLVDIPTACPHCGERMHPETIDAYILNIFPDVPTRVVTLHRCTVVNCKKFYVLDHVRKDTTSKFITLKYLYRPPINVSLAENVEKVSPMFVKIYNEAVQAEQEGLEHIAGVGYRKAAEFLIKDYVIAKNPDQEEQVKDMFLGKVISKYLSDFTKVQSLAKAVAWIGNDETHYVRRHNDKDLQHLKKFILSSAQFIAADYDADEALEFTSSDNP